MADEQAPVEETPETAPAATEGQTQQEQAQAIVDWEKRYNDLRPQYDRTTQEAANYRQLVEGLHSDDPDTRQWAAQELGLQLADDTEDQFAQHEEPLTRAEFQQFLAEQQAAQQEQARGNEVRALVDSQLQQWGLDEEDGNDVLAYAIHALPPTQEGLPDVWAAYERFQKRREAIEQQGLKAWRESKRAPHVTPGGQSATQQPDLDEQQDRVAWMTQRFADLSADT